MSEDQYIDAPAEKIYDPTKVSDTRVSFFAWLLTTVLVYLGAGFDIRLPFISTAAFTADTGWTAPSMIGLFAVMAIVFIHALFTIAVGMQLWRQRSILIIGAIMVLALSVSPHLPSSATDSFRNWANSRYGISWQPGLSMQDNNRNMARDLIDNKDIRVKVERSDGRFTEVYSVAKDGKLYLYDATENKELPTITKP